MKIKNDKTKNLFKRKLEKQRKKMCYIVDTLESYRPKYKTFLESEMYKAIHLGDFQYISMFMDSMYSTLCFISILRKGIVTNKNENMSLEQVHNTASGYLFYADINDSWINNLE